MYFAKYIPVEETRTNEEGVYDFQKVKLFLCSTDLTIGDEICDSKGNKKIVESQGYIDKLHMLLYSQEVGKVIGEISPGAKWVKEGDEFKKEDLLQQGTGVNLTQNGGFITIKCPTCETFH
jgi:hypothetical protein